MLTFLNSILWFHACLCEVIEYSMNISFAAVANVIFNAIIIIKGSIFKMEELFDALSCDHNPKLLIQLTYCVAFYYH